MSSWVSASGWPLRRASSMVAAARPISLRGVTILASLGSWRGRCRGRCCRRWRSAGARVSTWPDTAAGRPPPGHRWCRTGRPDRDNAPAPAPAAGRRGEAGGLLGQQVLAAQAEILHRLVVAFHPQLGAHVEPRAEVDQLASAPAQHLCYHGPGGCPVIHADHHVDGALRQIHGLHHRDAGGGDHLASALGVLAVGEDQPIHVIGEQEATCSSSRSGL